MKEMFLERLGAYEQILLSRPFLGMTNGSKPKGKGSLTPATSLTDK
jgi:hypothetical protein